MPNTTRGGALRATNPTEQYLTTNEVATLMRRSSKTIIRMFKRGILPYVDVSAGDMRSRYLARLQDIKDYMTRS